MSKRAMTVLMISFMSLLVACQNGGQTLAPAPAANTTYQGPSDGGGGDTCNGRVIESFRVDITTLEEYKEVVQPLVEKVMSKEPKSENSPFLFGAKMKNWYIIDCKLQDIPKERKGLYLESYQTAVHTSREIFIDSTSYNAMSKEEKGRLLLHEMVMSYYLMKYLSIEDVCKIGGNCPPDVVFVSNWKLYRPEPYRPLDSEDHQKIRGVTAWLLTQKEDLNPDTFRKALDNHDFDKRFRLVGNSKSEAIEVDPHVLVRMFKKHQWGRSFPKFCHFHAVSNLSQSACTTEVEAEVRKSTEIYDALFVKIKVLRDGDKKIFENIFAYPITNKSKKAVVHTTQFGTFLNATSFGMTSNWPNAPGVTPVGGMRSQMLLVMTNFTDKENPEIFQVHYNTLVWYSFEEEIIIRDGYKYKTTSGYSTVLDEETETLFVENELPFTFRFNLPGKTFLKMEMIGKAD